MMRLTAEVRESIKQWLLTAAVGDTLLLPRTVSETEDHFAVVKVADTEPKISRLEVTRVERIETTVNVAVLPVHEKKVKKKKARK